MRKWSLLLLALALVSAHALAQDKQDNQPSQPNFSVGYINCPTGEQFVFLYESVTNFDVVSMPRCQDRVDVLGRVQTTEVLGAYLNVRTADGKEGFVPERYITAKEPAKSRVAIAEAPVGAGQAAPLAGPLSKGRSNFAYDLPRAEVFGGFSYMSMDWQTFAPRSKALGWNTSAAFNLNPWLGVEGDLAGHYQRNCTGSVGLTCANLTFMGGPRITVHRSGNITAFAHGLVGLGDLTLKSGGASLSWRDLAWAGGGGVDYAVTNNISVRVGQFDYLRTQYLQNLGGTHQNNFRISGGVVFRIGHVVTE